MKQNAIDELIEQVGALCRVYCGDRAESEQWIKTCERFNQLNETVRRARAIRNAEKRKAAKAEAGTSSRPWV